MNCNIILFPRCFQQRSFKLPQNEVINQIPIVSHNYFRTPVRRIVYSRINAGFIREEIPKKLDQLLISETLAPTYRKQIEGEEGRRGELKRKFESKYQYLSVIRGKFESQLPAKEREKRGGPFNKSSTVRRRPSAFVKNVNLTDFTVSVLKGI